MENICRTCLRTSDKLMPLFQTPLLVFKIIAIAPVEISASDNLPQAVCEECSENIDRFFIFKEMVVHSDITLKKMYNQSNQNVVETEQNCNEVNNEEVEENSVKVEYVLHDTVETTTNFHCKSEASTYSNGSSGSRDQVNELASENMNSEKSEKRTREKSIVCQMCPESLSDIHCLIEHNRIVHNAYTCESCGIAFDVEQDFHNHVSYSECWNIDQRTYNTNTQKRRKQHHQQKHRRYKQNFPSAPKSKNQSRSRNNTSYACNYCSKHFSEKRSLNMHLNSKHKKILDKWKRDNAQLNTTY